MCSLALESDVLTFAVAQYPGTNTSFTAATAPAPVNLKKEGKVSPYIITASPYDYSSTPNNEGPITPSDPSQFNSLDIESNFKSEGNVGQSAGLL